MRHVALQGKWEQSSSSWCFHKAVPKRTRLAVVWIMDDSTHFSPGSVLQRLQRTPKVFLFLSTLCSFFIMFLSAALEYSHQCLIRCQSCSVTSDLFSSLLGTFSFNFTADIQVPFLCWFSRGRECCLYMRIFTLIEKVLTFRKYHLSHRLLKIDRLIKGILPSDGFVQIMFICDSEYN